MRWLDPLMCHIMMCWAVPYPKTIPCAIQNLALNRSEPTSDAGGECFERRMLSFLAGAVSICTDCDCIYLHGTWMDAIVSDTFNRWRNESDFSFKNLNPNTTRNPNCKCDCHLNPNLVQIYRAFCFSIACSFIFTIFGPGNFGRMIVRAGSAWRSLVKTRASHCS